MQIHNISFPHPVLGIRDDVVGSEYLAELTVSTGKKVTTLTVKQVLTNSTLNKLISEGKAVFCLQLNCRQTLFRDTYEFKDYQKEISVKTENLRNKVLTDFYIVAKGNIHEYSIEGANQDYEGYKFEIEKGDVLAFGGSGEFLAVKDWEMLKGCKSFMEIIKGDKKSGPFEVFLSGEQVVITLSWDDYDRYYAYSDQTNLSGIFHSSIVLPVLTYVISELTSSKGERYEDCKWYQVLEFMKAEDEILKKIDWSDPANVPLIAQTLLEFPLTRALNNLNDLSNSSQKED